MHDDAAYVGGLDHGRHGRGDLHNVRSETRQHGLQFTVAVLERISSARERIVTDTRNIGGLDGHGVALFLQLETEVAARVTVGFDPLAIAADGFDGYGLCNRAAIRQDHFAGDKYGTIDVRHGIGRACAQIQIARVGWGGGFGCATGVSCSWMGLG